MVVIIPEQVYFCLSCISYASRDLAENFILNCFALGASHYHLFFFSLSSLFSKRMFQKLHQNYDATLSICILVYVRYRPVLSAHDKQMKNIEFFYIGCFRMKDLCYLWFGGWHFDTLSMLEVKENGRGKIDSWPPFPPLK